MSATRRIRWRQWWPLVLVASATPSFAQEQPARVVFANPGPVDQERIVSFSLPLPRGRWPELQRVCVATDTAPCVPILRWSDGSVRVARVDARVAVAAGHTQTIAVEPQAGSWEGEGDEPPWRAIAELPLAVELVDPWGRTYTAALSASGDAGPGPADSPRVRVARLRGRPERTASDGARESFLDVRADLLTFRGERRAVLTLVLENGVSGRPAFGAVRLRSFALRSTSPGLQFLPRFASENALEPPERLSDGGYRQVLIADGDQNYLGDRTAKAFRLDLFFDEPELDEEVRRAGRWAAERPVAALPSLRTVRRSGAFGAHGGPAARGGETDGLAEELLLAWRREVADFGPFGGLGDPRDAAAQGTPRNGPCALHNVVRWSSTALLRAAEAIVLQQGLRPTPGYRPRLPEATAAFRQGLSARAVERPHGFTALDYEHFSVDLLFDFYWLTGDTWALDELRRAGQGLVRMLAGVPFLTARGEGWCLQGGVLISVATGDRALLQTLQQRFHDTILPALGGAPDRPWALRQPAHPDALDGDTPFDAPWQMAALIHGLHALWRETGDQEARRAIQRVAWVMATHGWIDGVGPKYLYSTDDPQRHQMPAGSGPTEGTARMQVGAFVLAAETAVEELDRSLFAARADFLMADYGDLRSGEVISNPWFQIYFDRLQP